jgi:HEAT repeat protein
MTGPDLLKLLLDPCASPEQRWSALRSLASSSLPARERAQVLNVLLKDDDREIRLGAAMQAGALGDPSTAEVLWELVATEQDYVIEANALDSLADLVGPQLLPTLIDRLKSGDETHQLGAVGVVSRIGTEEGLRVLREALKNHPTPSIRFKAAVHLATLGHPEGLDLLSAHLQDGSWLTRLSAVFGLCALGARKGFEQLMHLLSGSPLEEPEGMALMALLRVRLGLLENTDEEVVQAALGWVRSRLNEEGEKGEEETG